MRLVTTHFRFCSEYASVNSDVSSEWKWLALILGLSSCVLIKLSLSFQ